MNIRERQVAYAYALVENARQTIHIASCALGNLQYGDGKDLHADFNAALRNVQELCAKIELILDANTDYNCPVVHVKKGETK